MEYFNNFLELFNKSGSQENKLSNNTDKLLDKFIKKTFILYLKQSKIFNMYASIYDNNSNFDKECKDIYIFTEKIYKNFINKINIPFDINFNKKSLKNKNMYIFNLDNISQDSFLYDENLKRERHVKKKFLCKLIAMLFVKLYILIKGIYTTFNIDFNTSNINTIKHSNEEEIKEDSESNTQENIEEDTSELLTGGGILDNITSLFNTQKEKEKEKPDINLNSNSDLKDYEEEDNQKEYLQDEEDDQKDDEYDDEIVSKQSYSINNVNLFFTFINSVCGKSYDNLEKNLEYFPSSISELANNLKKSNIFDILCDNNLYNIFKSNILFNDNNLDKLFYSSTKILNKIKEFDYDYNKSFYK